MKLQIGRLMATLPLLLLVPAGSTAITSDIPVPLFTSEISGTGSPIAVPPVRRSDLTHLNEGLRSDRVAFSVEVGAYRTSFPVFGMTVLPGERVPIRTEPGGGSLMADSGTVSEEAPGIWTWQAPGTAGVVGLKVNGPGDSGTVHLNVFVMHPATSISSGSLNGYRIGDYMPRGNRSAFYEPPLGFIEVVPEDEDILVSPHFSIGQFLCKQPGEPRYLALSLPLLVKLERVYDAVREAGYAVQTLTVMSGFRTPAYNRAIGNTTTFSRHLWGDAADIYIDADGDGNMDDLNGDGVSNIADARVLSSIVQRVVDQHTDDILPGGLSAYRPNSAHGPFIHVDARGSRARW